MTLLAAHAVPWCAVSWGGASPHVGLFGLSGAPSAFLAQVGLWVAFYLVSFLPVGLWLNSGAWFTEMGMNAILPWQECVSVGGDVPVGRRGTLGGLPPVS